jgi:hypothetical protein
MKAYVQHHYRGHNHGEKMIKRARTRDMIMEFTPTMDYVSGPALNWRGFILFLAKIGKNYMAIPQV